MAGMEYSPLSDVCTEREKPVAAFRIATPALGMLPPEASVILPERVAVTAWPDASAAQKEMRASRQANEQKSRTAMRLIRFMTRPPRETTAPNAHFNVRRFITGPGECQAYIVRGVSWIVPENPWQRSRHDWRLGLMPGDRQLIGPKPISAETGTNGLAGFQNVTFAAK